MLRSMIESRFARAGERIATPFAVVFPDGSQLANQDGEPEFKLVFRNGDNVLGERAYPMIEGPIAPGGRLGFSHPFDDPPDGTTNIVPTVE